MNGQVREEADDQRKGQVANSSTGFDSTSHQESLVPRGQEAGPTNLSQTGPGSHPQSRGASGPRTAQGKQRSKLNAVKHGIFAKVVLPNGESRLQYESLLRDFFEDLKPQGRLEELLVEKLVMLSWRHKRVIEAEIAEIRDKTEFLEWEEMNQELLRQKELYIPPYNPRLIHYTENPEILEKCLILLEDLKKQLEVRGFEKESDFAVLERIYGAGGPLVTLFDIYCLYYNESQIPEEERQRKQLADSPAACKERVLQSIGYEINRLKNYQEIRESVISQRTTLARIRQRIAHSPDLDRLLRYEASIERSFDRTLNQLERLQRMRLGQPASPTVQVHVLP
jgi:hypothetical protein